MDNDVENNRFFSSGTPSQSCPQSLFPGLSLELPLKWHWSHTFFVADSNRLAHQWIRLGHWPAQGLWLWGPTGCGKSHLARLWSEKNQGQWMTLPDIVREDSPWREKSGPWVIDLSQNTAQDQPHRTTQLLYESSPQNSSGQNVKSSGRDHNATAAKDAQTVMAQNHMDASLLAENKYSITQNERFFHFLQHASQGMCLFLSRLEPGLWYRQTFSTTIPDVLSRLQSAMVTEIRQPEDQLWKDSLAKGLGDLGWHPPEKVLDYLCQRVSRTFASILYILQWVQANPFHVFSPRHLAALVRAWEAWGELSHQNHDR